MGKEVAVEHVAPRAGDIRHSLADITVARELLGFEPLVRWEEGLPATVAYLSALRSEGPTAAAHTLTAARVAGTLSPGGST
jgi:nucleoside-diphosphate-sugar epimerase